MPLSHPQLWAAIDGLARREGLSASGLARRAGLDATSFNPSKRFGPGEPPRPRWPSTESLTRILEATGVSLGAFAALADPTRRDLVARLTLGDATVGQLAAPYAMSLQAVSKHLTVLEKVGDNRYRNTSNEQPVAAPDVVMHQGMLEGSNVKPISEITRMIQVTRAYESMAKMMDANAELSRRSIERMGKLN